MASGNSEMESGEFSFEGPDGKIVTVNINEYIETLSRISAKEKEEIENKMDALLEDNMFLDEEIRQSERKIEEFLERKRQIACLMRALENKKKSLLEEMKKGEKMDNGSGADAANVVPESPGASVMKKEEQSVDEKNEEAQAKRSPAKENPEADKI